MTTYRVIGEAPVVVDGIERAPGTLFEAELPCECARFMFVIGALAVVPPAHDREVLAEAVEE